MNYRKDKYGNDISILGYGCMRFSRSGGKVDVDKAEEEILAAFRGGVNYYDTAYVYPGSEAALGEILERNHIRGQVAIATKLPHYLIKAADSMEKYFREQLRRLRTDYVDYYLMHMLTDVQTWERLKGLGVVEWLEEKRNSGEIRQVGFSYHGNSDMFCQLVDEYHWDFCQIQYNYMDENSQAGRRGLQYAASKGLPVIIMEPLRGGKLVNNLPEEAKKLFDAHPVKHTPAGWALRWLWNQPEVTCVLSGMNSEDMVNENIRIASKAEPGHFTDEDMAIVERIKQIIREREKVGCTGCRYCMPCPKGVDIPGNFYYYNLMYMEKKSSARFEFAQNMGMRKEPGFASQCVGCGKCEQHCPQQIPIREKLKEAGHALRPLPYKIGIHAARKMILH